MTVTRYQDVRETRSSYKGPPGGPASLRPLPSAHLHLAARAWSTPAAGGRHAQAWCEELICPSWDATDLTAINSYVVCVVEEPHIL
eukprot:gene6682-3347_t